MKIRDRILWSVVTAIAIAVATSIVLWTGLNSVRTAVERNDAVVSALNQCFELSALTTDYLVYYEPRAQRQWTDKHASLGEALAALDSGIPQDEVILERVRERHVEAGQVFEDIVQAHARGENGEFGPEVSRELETRLTARLLIVMQSMVSDAVKLGEHSSLAAIDAQTTTTNMVLGIVLGAVVIMGGIGFSTLFTVVRPLERLRMAVHEVGQGDLYARSGVDSTDEVGDLATAFDGMVGALQRSYEQLEAEVRVRRSAEAELSEYRDHLEHLVDERTEELLRLNEDLTRATRAKDDFLASMSHELRTPLNSIIGFTEIMLRGLAGDLNDEQRRQLHMVHESGQQLLLLIDDVLDLARINAGHIKVSAEEFSLVEAVSRLTEMMQPLASAKDLDLSYRFDGNAPYVISSDRGKIDQILLNLLSNAIKFTEEGSVLVVVRLQGDSMVAFDVIDTGIGVPPGDMESIFEQFHRGHHDLVATHPGTGLGLPISRRLAEVLGGSLEVESAEGGGSVFTLIIPIEYHPGTIENG
jgi:signal transduction histidine kinase